LEAIRLIIGYDILKGSNHAIDYLTSFDNTETVALGNNPCDTIAGCNPAVFTTFAIPADPLITNAAVIAGRLAQPGNSFRMYNGTITAVSYVTYAGGEERQVSVTFTATASNPVLAWGGHVAWQGEWGAGLSAGGISGSPYHMRLIDLDGGGGNQDRSLSADAVAIPAKVTVTKLVPFAMSNPTSFSFAPGLLDFASVTFNATGSCPGICLTPTTDPSGTTSSASFTFPPILTNLSGLIGDQRTLQETVNPPPGWHLIGLGCFNSGPGGTASISVSTPAEISSGIGIVRVRPVEGDNIQCTFTNSVVTAANATISGRVVTAQGFGISRAQITVVNAATSESKVAITNPFGYFSVGGLEVDNLYVVSVAHKSYRFPVSSRSFMLNDDLTGLVFTAEDPKQ
jgi:hypothetical protein